MKERETISWEEFAYSNYLSIEAIVSLLIRKKILTKEEILTSTAPSSWSVQTHQHGSGKNIFLHLQACHECL